MKKSIFKYIIPILLLIGGFTACKKNNFVVDKDPLVPPEAARFVMTPTASNSYYSYFIKQTPAPGTVFTAPIGVTTVSGSDRKVKLTYSSLRAVPGTHYNGPAEVTIPAGSATADLSFQGLFSGYSGGRKDTVKIKITSADGFVKPNAYQDSIMLIMQQYCDVVLANLGGNFQANEYTAGGSFNYGPYPSAVINLTSTGPTSASGQFVNFYDYGWDDLNFTMDYSNADPTKWKITIPVQATNGGGYPYVRSTPSGINTFSSCDQTFTTSLDLMTSPTTVDYSGYQIRLKR